MFRRATLLRTVLEVDDDGPVVRRLPDCHVADVATLQRVARDLGMRGLAR